MPIMEEAKASYHHAAKKVEEYLLNLGTILLNKIDSNSSTESKKLYLSISYSNTKISQNSLTLKIIIENSIMEKFEFLINIMVKFENNSNTEISISHKGLVDHFYLNSKHKKQDLDLLIDSAYNNITNKIKK